MRVRSLVMLLAVSVLAGVTQLAGAATRLLEHVPLQWRPTSDLNSGTVSVNDVPIHIEPFRDVRSNKQAIGMNLEEDTPKPVTTNDDVGAFVSSHLRELFTLAGLNTVDGRGAVTIKGEVRDFFVRETTTYHSELAVHLTVLGRDGRKLWSGVASGEARRFGHSYKLEDYYEVLSDALVNAVSSMLKSTQFQKALSGD